MSINNNVYTVLDNGRTHIALGLNYIGNVNTYNNFLTRFFTRLFGYSMKVEIDGKKKVVNKKSYRNFLNRCKDNGNYEVSLKDLQKFAIIQVENGKLISGHLVLRKTSDFMRDKVSENTKSYLSRKMFRAFKRCDEKKALKCLGKGADVDVIYKHKEDGKKIVGTLILFAAYFKLWNVGQSLKEAGARMTDEMHVYETEKEMMRKEKDTYTDFFSFDSYYDCEDHNNKVELAPKTKRKIIEHWEKRYLHNEYYKLEERDEKLELKLDRLGCDRVKKFTKNIYTDKIVEHHKCYAWNHHHYRD